MTLGKSKEAKADLQRALELDQENADTCEALATVLIDLDETEEAEKIVKKLALLSPNSIAPLTISAQLNAKKKDLTAALDDLNRALELEPTNTGVLLLRSYLYHEMNLFDQALADVKKVLEIRPQFDQARRFQIALLAQQGDLDKTLAELKRFHEEQPDDPELTLQLAILYSMKKESSKAIELYTKLIEADPKNSAALEGRAGVLLGTGKQADAIADFDKALAISPDESDMLNNLAWVLSTSPDDKLRDGKRAIKLATKACELTDYQQAHILSTLAAAYAETGDFEQAVKYSTKAVDLVKKSKDPEIQEALQKELDSYKAKKPWRERLEDGLPATEE
jgi:tetratricopeptide (TPR) repeat protein